MDAGRNQTRDVRDVGKEDRTDFVGDLAECAEIDRARIRRRSTLDHLRVMFACERPNHVVVDLLVRRRNAVGNDREMLAGEVDGAAVGEVATVVEIHRENRVAPLEYGFIDRRVRLGSRVRLNVRMVRTKERLRTLDREGLDLIDLLAAAVVASARIALGVFVREHRPDGFEHRVGYEIL